MIRIAMFWLLAVVLALPAASGEPPKDGDAKHLAELAKEFKVPETRIAQLRDSGMGWGEIGLALAIAERSGESLDELLQLRRWGLGWEEIVRKCRFTIGEVQARAWEAEWLGRESEMVDRRPR